MADLLVRDIDPEVYKRMKKAAEAEGKSLAQTARDVFEEKFKPSKEDVWKKIDSLRARIGRVEGDSTADIREDRDNDEPYR